MVRRSLCLALAVVLPVAAAIVLAASQGGRPAEHAERELTPEVAYAVPVTGDRAQFDLPAAGTRYLLVISSLGRADRSYQVRLAARPVAEVVPLNARRIEPLLARPQIAATGDATHNLDAHPERARRSVVGRAPSPSEVEREFFLHVTDGDLNDPEQYVRIPAQGVGEGQEIRVYLDAQMRPEQLHARLVEEIVRLFDESILPRSRKLLGDYQDVDRDGKFAVVITPWLDRLQGGRTSVGGLARSADFRSDLEPPLGNRCDAIYLNSNLRPNDHLQTLLVHEFAHALCFSQRIGRRSDPFPPAEDWLNEAVAHLAEDLHGTEWSNLDHRVSQFLEDPQTAPLVVADYYRAGLWRDHGCRGACYLFLRWCVDQFGERLLRDLIRSPLSGTANLENATGVSFEELYRRWSVALFFAGRGEGRGAQPQRERTFDLYRTMGDWQLAGPRTIVWDSTQAVRELTLRGTSSAFVELNGTEAETARRIEIEGEPGTRLQVSVIRLDPSWPKVDVQAAWEAIADSELHELQLTVDVAAGSAVQIEAVACEWRDERASRCFLLDRARLEASPEREGAAARLNGRYVLPRGARALRGGEWTVKVVARDAKGRRTAGRCDPGQPPVETPALAIAGGGPLAGKRGRR